MPRTVQESYAGVTVFHSLNCLQRLSQEGCMEKPKPRSYEGQMINSDFETEKQNWETTFLSMIVS